MAFLTYSIDVDAATMIMAQTTGTPLRLIYQILAAEFTPFLIIAEFRAFVLSYCIKQSIMAK